MQAGIGDVAEPGFELQIEIVDIAEDAAEKEVLADIAERSLDLALRLRPIGTTRLGQEAVVMREIPERAVVNDLAVGVLADHRSLHPIIEDLARYAAKRFERRLVAGEYRLHRLTVGKATPDQSGVAKHDGEQPDDMHGARLLGEAHAELGKVDLRLLARQRLEADGKAFAAACWA
jgi:hypothetical protein